MRIAWWAIVVLVSVSRAQEDAAWLAWSGVGEAAGRARPLGRSQPAALAWERSSTFALSVVPSLYGIPGLRSGGAGLAVGGDGYGYGVSAAVVEAGPVRFFRVRGATGVEVAPGLAVGLSGAAGQWSFPRYGPLLEWEVGIGVQWQSEQVTTSVLVTAWGQEGRPFGHERLRVIAGGAVRLTEAVTAIAEVVDADDLEIQTGARVTLLEEVSFIVSWSDGTNCVGGGCEVTVDAWQLLTAARWHPILGWTHGITLSHEWR